MPTTLDTLFTTEEQKPIADGIHKFIRLLGLRTDSNQLLWTSDESDLISVLELLKTHIKDSVESSVAVKNKNVANRIPIDEVQNDVKEYLLSGYEASNQVRLSCNLRMYHLVIDPVIRLFEKITRDEAIQHVDTIIDDIIDLILNSDAYGDHDDAIVVQEQLRHMIHKREEQRKSEVLQKRKTFRKKKDWFVEEISNEDEVCRAALDFN